MPQQQAYVPLAAIPSIRRQARLVANTPPRDPQAEAELKATLIEQLVKVRQAQADIKKGTMGAYTDMMKAELSAMTSGMSALASAAGANAQAMQAGAGLIKDLYGQQHDIEGKIIGGVGDPKFAEKMDPHIREANLNLTTILTGGGGAAGNLLALEGAMNVARDSGDANAYAQAKAAYIQAVSKESNLAGPGGLSQMMLTEINSSAGDSNLRAPSVDAAMKASEAAVGAAIRNRPDLPEDVRQDLYGTLVGQIAATVGSSYESSHPGEAAAYSRRQDELRVEHDRKAKVYLDTYHTGLDKGTRARFNAIIDKTNDEVFNGSPLVRAQMAKENLAKRGVMLPPDATPAQKAEFEKQFITEMKQLPSSTVFMRTMADAPSDAALERTSGMLEEEIANIGKTRLDAFQREAMALQERMGPENFRAWMQLTGSRTAEEAAWAANDNPTKLKVFRSLAESDKRDALLAAPREFKAQINQTARMEDRNKRLTARETAQFQAATPEAAVSSVSPGKDMPEPDTSKVPEKAEPIEPVATPKEEAASGGAPQAPTETEKAKAAMASEPGAMETAAAQQTAVNTATQQALANAPNWQMGRGTQYGAQVPVNPVNAMLAQQARGPQRPA